MPATALEPPAPRSTALTVLGSLLALLAASLLAAGAAALWVDGKRDADGYLGSGAHRFSAPGYAITHDGVELSDLPGADSLGGAVRLRLRATGRSGHPVFVGIGPTRAVRGYLAAVRHAEVRDLDLDPFRARYAPR